MTIGIWDTVTRWKRPTESTLGESKLAKADDDLTAAPLSGDRSPCDMPGGDDREKLVRRFLEQGRGTILLRPQVARTLTTEQLAAVCQVVRETCVALGAGDVSIPAWTFEENDGECMRGISSVVAVPPFYVDRFPVTNRDYMRFVADGGYTQQALWDEAIRPELEQFVDRTGQPGPRYWRDGAFDPDLGHCPVLGVSWFEADAFARWAGKRLPSDAQWLRAAAHSNPRMLVATSAASTSPVGKNVWSAGIGRTLPVNHFADNARASVSQMFGNVWEWTSDDVAILSYGKPVRFDSTMKKLRGGAFDTYFDHEASVEVPSGDLAVARRANVGFRCVIPAEEIVTVEFVT